jgi:hypothetical protein
VLQLLPVPLVGEGGEQLWHWDGRHAGSISVNGSLVAAVSPLVVPRAVGPSAAPSAVTYQFSSAELGQLFDDACLVQSSTPTPLPAVRDAPADAFLPYKLGELSMFCDASAGEGGDTRPCIVCAAKHPPRQVHIPLSEMRKHTAAHILHGDIMASACGFCGGADSCTAKVIRKQSGVQPDVECCVRGYGHRFTYKPCFKKDTSSCTNTPMPCPFPGCSDVRWKYAMPEHWAAAHADTPLPPGITIGDNERAAIRKALK